MTTNNMQPIAETNEVEDARKWLIDHKASTGFSWSELSKRIGIPTGTLSQFGSEKGYRGDEAKLAQQVNVYRQSLIAASRVTVEMPVKPGYFQTETSQHITNILTMGRMGRVVAVATGAGLGKSETARNFRDCYPHVSIITLKPSLSGVAPVLMATLKQLGEANAKGSPQMLADRVCELLANRHKPMLIFDEVQHATVKTIEEIRSINDETGAGIALMGNIPVLRKIEGGGRDEAFAQIYSRLAFRMVRALPLRADAEALAKAWGVEDQEIIDLIVRISQVPGGLRNSTHALELASMLAMGEEKPFALDHLQNAWAQISGRGVM